MRALSLPILSICVLATAAVALPSSERTEPAPIFITISPWQGQSTITAGDKLIISIAIENISNQTIAISGNYVLNWDSPYGFKVWRDGVEQRETPAAEQLRKPGLGSSQLHEILPGKQDEATYDLGAYFDVSRPGTYKVQFFGSEGTILPTKDDPEDYVDKRRFESNIVTIVVTP